MNPSSKRRIVLPIFAMTVFLGLVVCACESPAGPITFESVVQDDRSHYEHKEPALFVLSDRASVGSLPVLSSLDAYIAFATTELSEYLFLVALHGHVPGGGHGIEIVEIEQAGMEVNVRVRFTSPEENATAMVTSPFHAVRVPRAELESGNYTFVLVEDESGEEVARTEHRIK